MYLFASEAVSAGHPDKCADIIADTIVDTLLQLDPDSKVATEVFISGKHVIIGGEVKTKVPLDDSFYEEIVKKAFNQIGYPEVGFDRGETFYPDEAVIHTYVSTQSPDITRGVVKADNEIGAGDQGMMFGYEVLREMIICLVHFPMLERSETYYMLMHSNIRRLLVWI